MKTSCCVVEHFALISKSDDLPAGLDRYVLFNPVGEMVFVRVEDLQCAFFPLENDGNINLVEPLNDFELE